MLYQQERKILEDFIHRKNLKSSEKRMQILEIFLSSGEHLTVEELYKKVRKKYPSIGSATIYRTLKIFSECGICKVIRLENGKVVYEPLVGREHHDHVVCLKCGKFVEVVDPEIERLQELIAEKAGFTLIRHSLQLYGICEECKSI